MSDTNSAADVPPEGSPSGARTSHRRNFSMTLATNVAIAILGLATGSISARILGPTGRGELSAIQTIPSFLGLLALLGLPNAVAYFSAKDPQAARSLTLTATTLESLTAMVVMGAGYMLMPWALQQQSATTIGDARIYLVFILLQALQVGPYLALQGLGRFRTWNLLRLAPPLCWLTILALGWWLHRGIAGWLSRAYLVAYALTIPVAAGTLWRSTRGPSRFAPERISAMLRYGAPTAASVLPFSLNLRLDQMLMAALLAPNLLGLYAVGVSWSSVMAPVFGALGSTMFPALASTDDDHTRRRLLGQTLRLGALLALVLGAGLAAITPLALPLVFGPRFAPAVAPTLVLIAAASALSFNTVLDECTRGLGGPAWSMYAQLVALPITLVILGTTLTRWKLMAAAMASLVSYLAVVVTMLVGVRRLSGLSIAELVRPQPGDIELLRQTLDLAWQQAKKLLTPA